MRYVKAFDKIEFAMLKSIKLRAGRSAHSSADSIVLTPMTVFVGPNGSGKSRLLQEIESFCNSGECSDCLVLQDVQLRGLSNSYAKEIVKASHNYLDRATNVVRCTIARAGISRTTSPAEDLVDHLQHPHKLNGFCSSVLRILTMPLDGRTRLNLVQEVNAGDFQDAADSTLKALFKDDAKRKQVRQIVYDAFKEYLVIDPTKAGTLRMRLAKTEPTPEVERGLTAESVEFHGNARLVWEYSDGIKAFIGIIASVIAGNPLVILIDEPEAFLHPSLVFKLGVEVSAAVRNGERRVFAATHSPQFLFGCIQSGVPLNIVRLTYQNDVATSRVLESKDIIPLMRDPLMRSVNLMSGLFYDYVVVTESDADRAFYQEVNERLLRYKPQWGIPNCLFVNGQNKQTVHRLVAPLRRLGIPTAGIVDIDVVKEGGTPWTSLLKSLAVPEASRVAWGMERATIYAAMQATKKDMKRNGGINILAASDAQAAEALLHKLAEYGLFIVPIGELESWLRPLGVVGDKSDWLVRMFKELGEDGTSDFVKPGSDDVWKFIANVREWLMDVNRKGIPD